MHLALSLINAYDMVSSGIKHWSYWFEEFISILWLNYNFISDGFEGYFWFKIRVLKTKLSCQIGYYFKTSSFLISIFRFSCSITSQAGGLSSCCLTHTKDIYSILFGIVNGKHLNTQDRFLVSISPII